ncbi:unnamed protein product [Lactuca saligna]|uniref:Uncharacterized protein n=1 Tax=Lactuca saligna TaxID=75948 RepID=A0AA36E529_LACSI|nr:unnamed protein product [Lactuca saligna]
MLRIWRSFLKLIYLLLFPNPLQQSSFPIIIFSCYDLHPYSRVSTGEKGVNGEDDCQKSTPRLSIRNNKDTRSEIKHNRWISQLCSLCRIVIQRKTCDQSMSLDPVKEPLQLFAEIRKKRWRQVGGVLPNLRLEENETKSRWSL